MFAIIKTGGKQYKVSEGDKIKIEKIEAEPESKIEFDEVLLVSDGDKTEVGAPTVSGAKVQAKVLSQTRDDKKVIFRYHSKTRYRKLKGHRQPLTEVLIEKI